MMNAAPMLAPLPLEGRQSAMAAGVQRGVRRLFAQLGHASLPEFTLASGRRADVIALAPDGLLTIVEIKSSVADFRTDGKWPDYRDFCDRLYFAVASSMDQALLPADAGLIVADAFGAEVLRDPLETPLNAARRRAMTISFARAAAMRLHGLYDPEML